MKVISAVQTNTHDANNGCGCDDNSGDVAERHRN
jgi:hypothetical protein